MDDMTGIAAGGLDAGAISQRSQHALTPLSPTEIRAVVSIVRGDTRFGPSFMFETIELKEPDKAALRAARRSRVRHVRTCFV